MPNDVEEQDSSHPLLDQQYTTPPQQEEEPVFQLIQRVRVECVNVVDSQALSYEQLRSTQINYSIVMPLLLKLSALGARAHDKPAPCLLFALLINRVSFLELSNADLAFSGVNSSRASLCELLAEKLLSAYDDQALLSVIAMPFNPFTGAQEGMFQSGEILGAQELIELKLKAKSMTTNALELAIYSGAKRFVQSPLTQRIIEAIYNGNIVYQSPDRTHSFMSDDYRKNPVVQVFDWRNSPWLDHYRLRVPKVRSALELFTFFTIVALFLGTQFTRDDYRLAPLELLYIFWSVGFALDEFCALNENGISMYLLGEHNLLDSIYCLIFFVYLGLRMSALATGDVDRSELAFDTLSMAAIILFPRLSISLVRNNVVLLALSSMIREFVLFMGLAALTASGFLCAFYVLARGSWDLGRIAWLMFRIWLGNSGLGFDSAQEFHPVFGPFLIVLYALLSQTLLLTILISLLSNTFAACQANARTEILHQRALRTLERVKSDALSSYMPPMNLVSLFILLPLRVFASPRWFHKTNTFLIRLFNLPILLYLGISVRFLHATTKPLLQSPSFTSSSCSFETPFRAATLIRNETRKVWASLPQGISWDGPLNSVGKVFERAVNEKAWEIRAVGEGLMEAGEEGVEEEDVMKTPLKGKAKPRGLPSIRETKDSDATSNLKMRPTHSRIGSLSSPLARLFGSKVETLEAGGGGGSRPTSLVASSSAPFNLNELGESDKNKALLERLDKLEAMLQVLVQGELARSSLEETAAGAKKPMTSLTGDDEQG